MSYAKALSDYLRTQEELNKREASGYWNPSQLGFCDRRNILRHDGLPENELDDRTLRLFWLGSAIHESLQRTFPFEVVGHEVKVKDEEYRLSGRVDTYARVDGVLEVVEFKSIASKKFAYKSLPDENHILQIGCYLTFPGEGDIVPQRGRLVYWSKDDARIEEYLVQPTDELKAKVKTELARLEGLFQEYKSTGKLPEATEVAWQPRYCGYAGTGKCCGDKAPDRKPVRVGTDNPSEPAGIQGELQLL